MNNMVSCFKLLDAKIRASDKDLPVQEYVSEKDLPVQYACGSNLPF